MRKYGRIFISQNSDYRTWSAELCELTPRDDTCLYDIWTVVEYLENMTNPTVALSPLGLEAEKRGLHIEEVIVHSREDRDGVE